MSKFRLTTLYFLGGFFFSLILLCFAISFCDCIFKQETLSNSTTPHNLKIKKIGITRKLLQGNEEKFNCFVDKASITIPTNTKVISWTEKMVNISGFMNFSNTNTLEKNLIFKGKNGSLDYKNYALIINDCLFNLDTHKQDFQNQIPFTSGMKTLEISLQERF